MLKLCLALLVPGICGMDHFLAADGKEQIPRIYSGLSLLSPRTSHIYPAHVREHLLAYICID